MKQLLLVRVSVANVKRNRRPNAKVDWSQDMIENGSNVVLHSLAFAHLGELFSNGELLNNPNICTHWASSNSHKWDLGHARHRFCNGFLSKNRLDSGKPTKLFLLRSSLTKNVNWPSIWGKTRGLAETFAPRWSSWNKSKAPKSLAVSSTFYGSEPFGSQQNIYIISHLYTYIYNIYIYIYLYHIYIYIPKTGLVYQNRSDPSLQKSTGLP